MNFLFYKQRNWGSDWGKGCQPLVIKDKRLGFLIFKPVSWSWATSDMRLFHNTQLSHLKSFTVLWWCGGCRVSSVSSTVAKHLGLNCSSFPSSSHHRVVTQWVRIFQINEGSEMGLAVSWRLEVKRLLEQKMTHGWKRSGYHDLPELPWLLA